MKTRAFRYELPVELIAQTPLERRDESRLMTVGRDSGEIGHRIFGELPELLREGDCLVLNDSKVIPARLYGKKESGGAVEILLLNEIGGGEWECMVRPGRRAGIGTRINFGGGRLQAEVVDKMSGGNRCIRFEYEGIFNEILEELGRMPLPPYIKEELSDKTRYQTVYAKRAGSAAAPTAGLHFTPELMERLKGRGVELRYITLHVGMGTFRPVKAENAEEHRMHPEYCEIPAETAVAIREAKREGRRVIACGTTSCRTLEGVAGFDGTVTEYSGEINTFIYPGYKFKCIDGLLTNFHLPESTLIMLVSAFAGYETTMRAYSEAVRAAYRFFSFGDAMLIIDKKN